MISVNENKTNFFNLSDKDWNILIKFLDAIKPIKAQLENDRRITHYLERIFSYINRVGHRGPCSLTLKKLEDLFPKSMKNIKSVARTFEYKNQPIEKSEKISETITPAANIHFYNGKIHPYKKQLKKIEFRPQLGPTVNELHESLSKATYDAFKCNFDPF